MTVNDRAFATAVTEAPAAPPKVIYSSREALDEYLADVRARRARRRWERQHRKYCLYAIRKLNEELAETETDGDEEIVRELQEVLAEFERRLGALEYGITIPFRPPRNAPAPFRDAPDIEPAPTAVETADHPPDTAEILTEEVLPDTTEVLTAEVPPDKAEILTEEILPALTVSAEVSSPVEPAAHIPSSGRKALAPEPDVTPSLSEADAVAADTSLEPSAPESAVTIPAAEAVSMHESRATTLATEIDSIATRWEVLEEEGLLSENGQFNRAQCFRLRALACRLGGACAQARDEGVYDSIRPDAQRLRDRLEQSREAAGERAPCPPFDDNFWVEGKRALSAEKWEELSAQYEKIAEAQVALQWLEEHQAEYGEASRLALLNAVAGVQQTLFETLRDVGSRDRLQTDLYNNLMASLKGSNPPLAIQTAGHPA